MTKKLKSIFKMPGDEKTIVEKIQGLVNREKKGGKSRECR